MSGLYNSVFGMNVATVLVAPMLTEEDPRSYFPRFRDCYVEDGKIVVYTRVGGNNRCYEMHGDHALMYDEGDGYWDFGEGKLYELPTFVETYDDDFDRTYGYYVFGVPEEWREDFDRVMAGDLAGLSDAYLERVAKCFGADPCWLRKMLDEFKLDPEALTAAPNWEAFFKRLETELLS